MTGDREKQALRELMEAAARKGVDLQTLIGELQAGAPAEPPCDGEAGVSGTQLGILRAVRVEAAKVFGGTEVARAFMMREEPRLDGRRPCDVAAEGAEGAERVLRLLGRIRYGGGRP